jgi:hypothetical protein
MINHPLFEINENIIIDSGPSANVSGPNVSGPNVSDYFSCEISANELFWLEKKHINKYLTANNNVTEYLQIYNQSDDIVHDLDMQNAFTLFKKLNNKILDLKTQNLDLEQRLKKYTNGQNHKRYYEKNKEKIKEVGASYLQKLKAENPEKIKEYSHRAYLKQKEKKMAAEAAEAEKNAR